MWTESRMLRRIVVPKRDERMGSWRELNSVDLHNFVLLRKYYWCQDSSVGILLGYGLDGPSLIPIHA
jgi:hypothetical protein